MLFASIIAGAECFSSLFDLLKMAFCDSQLSVPLLKATTLALGSTQEVLTDERRAASVLVEATTDEKKPWKAVPLSASWSFWKDLTKPHNKVRAFLTDLTHNLAFYAQNLHSLLNGPV